MVLSRPESAVRWEPVEVTLAFRLGELHLFERKLDGVADRRHFLRQSIEDRTTTVPYNGIDAGFYFLPAYPVQPVPPVVRRCGQWLWYTPYTYRHYYVDLRGAASFDEYLAHFSAKTRSTLRRKVRRFGDACGGSTDFRCLRRPGEMEEFLRLALPLSSRTYQARLLDVGLPSSQEFAAEIRDRAQRDEVRAYLLLKDGKAAAYVLSFCADGIATYDYVGFDPELRDLSPGTVLQYLLIEDLFRDKSISIFDFTEGEGEHKALFATDNCLCAKTYVLRATPGNRVMIQLHWGLGAVSSSLGSALDRLGLKRRFRALLRRQA